MSIISDNNLAIYLQQYDVNILNTDQLRPCNDKSCVSSEKGCCPDNVTPVPPNGPCALGGCAGTRYGCCPYSTEPKFDNEGSNCGTIAGSVLFSTVSVNPSNVPMKRVWNINLSGYLKPNVHKYYITFDFHKVDWGEGDKQTISFEDDPIGTFNVCGRVLNATKYINFTFCSETETVTIIIDTSKWDFRLKREAAFSFNINLNDDANPNCAIKASGPPVPPNIEYDFNSQFWLGDGEHCTLLNYDKDRGLTIWNNKGQLNYGTKENPNDGYMWLKENGTWFYLRYPYPKTDLHTLKDHENLKVGVSNDCNLTVTTYFYFYKYVQNSQVFIRNYV